MLESREELSRDVSRAVAAAVQDPVGAAFRECFEGQLIPRIQVFRVFNLLLLVLLLLLLLRVGRLSPSRGSSSPGRKVGGLFYFFAWILTFFLYSYIVYSLF